MPSSPKRSLIHGVAILAVSTSVVVGQTTLHGPTIPWMTWQEYQQGHFEKPYIFHHRAAAGNLIYFGAEHSNQPEHPQFTLIEKLWQELRPQVALVEGRLPPTAPSREVAIQGHGEPGFVGYLARRDGVPVISMDASLAEQAQALAARYPLDQVKLYFILRQVVRWKRFRDQASLDGDGLAAYLQTLAKLPQLSGEPLTEAAVATTFRKYFGDQGSYRDATQAWFDPLGQVHWVNQASKDLADDRNQAMVRQIITQLASGKRVLAVAGRTHTIMQERALRHLLERQSATDDAQPFKP
jgi:hypothetical protein